MIHQGHLFNIDSEIRRMRCVKVRHDPHNVFPIGSKVLVDWESYDFADSMNKSALSEFDLDIGVKHELKVHGLFPSRHGMPAFSSSQINIENLKAVNGKRLYNMHYIKPMKQFDIGNMTSVINYVNRFGAITLKFMNHDAAAVFMACLRPILKMYIIACTFGSNWNHTSSEFFQYGRSHFYVTFIDIPYCIPIWNPKKVDGMGMLITLMSDTQNSGRHIVSFTMSILLSNYHENIFKVDGCTANPREYVNDDKIGTLLDMASKAKKYEDHYAGKYEEQDRARAKKAKAKAKSPYENKMTYRYTSGDAIRFGSSSTNYGSATTSTTYYTTS